MHNTAATIPKAKIDLSRHIIGTSHRFAFLDRPRRREAAGALDQIDLDQTLTSLSHQIMAFGISATEVLQWHQVQVNTRSVGSGVSRRYVIFTGEKVLVAHRNVIWNASITLGLG
jgi:hypothetical protein